MTIRIYSEEDYQKSRIVLEAIKAGEYTKASELVRDYQIPVAPHIAMAIKNVRGAQHLIDKGYNLSEAEEKYGKDWLSR